MQTGSIIEANRALAAASWHVAALDAVRIPRMFGRRTAIDGARSALTHAAADADRAAMRLGAADTTTRDRVEQLREAARLVRATPVREVSIHAAARQLDDAIDGARADHLHSIQRDPQHTARIVQDLLDLEPRQLQTSDWRLLHVLLEAPHGRALLDGVPGVVSLPHLARRAATGDRHAIDDATRVFAHWHARDVAPDARAARTTELLDRPLQELDRADWASVRALIDAGGDANVPGTLDGLLPFREVVARRALAHRTDDIATERDLAAIERYLAAGRLEGVGGVERQQLMHSLIKRDPSELSRRDWATMHALLRDDARGKLLRGPRHLPRLIRLDEIAARMLERPFEEAGLQNTRRYFDAWRLTLAPIDERTRVARSIVERDPASFTADDWMALRTILDSDPDGSVLGGARHLEGLQPVRDLVSRNAEHPSYAAGGSYQMNRYLSNWRRGLDPDHPAKVARAIDAVATGQATGAERSLVGIEGHRLAELVQGRPAQEQSAIALAMLTRPDIASTRGVQGTLEVMRRTVASSTLPDAAEALRTRTLELLDLNLARLAGRTPDGAVRGWANHPDYAEMGRIRENVTLLDALAASQRPAVPTTPAADTLRW